MKKRVRYVMLFSKVSAKMLFNRVFTRLPYVGMLCCSLNTMFKAMMLATYYFLRWKGRCGKVFKVTCYVERAFRAGIT